MDSNYRCFEYFDDSNSDEEYALLLLLANEEERHKSKQNPRCGSVLGHNYIWRDRMQGHERLYHDYFSENPVYPSNIFRRRFRMSCPLFCRIQSAVEAYDPYFIQKQNSAAHWGLSSLQKVTTALRMLSYGAVADSVDEYIRMGESTTIETLRRFVNAAVALFSSEYLRSPNENDLAKLLEVGNRRGFPGMLGSINCMHWRWKNCPTTWKGMYTGYICESTIILEAVASYDLWIWHAFFGLHGSLNDINVLERSSIFTELVEGRAPKVNYSINGHDYTMEYCLADGIYPSWATFVKTIPSPQGNKRKYFTAAQESARKDVERAFGVLQARFAIVHGPARFWDAETLKNIMTACIIMHNMIIEDERDVDNLDFNYDSARDSSEPTISSEHLAELSTFIQTHYQIHDRGTHVQLQADLVEHLWQLHGGM